MKDNNNDGVHNKDIPNTMGRTMDYTNHNMTNMDSKYLNNTMKMDNIPNPSQGLLIRANHYKDMDPNNHQHRCLLLADLRYMIRLILDSLNPTQLRGYRIAQFDLYTHNHLESKQSHILQYRRYMNLHDDYTHQHRAMIHNMW